MMTNGIKYCSLEEAWGPVFAGIQNQDVSYDGSMVPIDNVKTMSVDQFENNVRPSYDDIRNYMGRDEEETGCNRFMKHFNKCEKCQEVILKKCKKLLKKKKIIEGFSLDPEKSSSSENNYSDIIIILLIGVFIIFILDTFVKLGKKMV